ncbi:MAG: VCBS repeat-containing protein [Planctomycetes bacterium]|nr:VCBS repeat-containing protein [Planctomycetota bacterium]
MLRRLFAVALAPLFLACSEAEPSAPTPVAKQAPIATPAPTTARPEPLFATRLEFDCGGKPETVVAADFDGDGRAELVAALLDPGRLVVWRGSANGPVEPPLQVAIDPWPLQPIVVPAGHFGSTKTRLALVSRATKSLAFVEPLAGASEAVSTLARAPLAAALGDFGADGKLELAFAFDDRTLAVLDETRATTTVELPHVLPRCVAFLGDGSGLVVGFQDSQSLVVFARDAAAQLAVERELALPGFPRHLAECDVDRDGDLELVVLGGDRAAWVFGFGEPGGSNAWRRAGARALDWTTSKIPLDLVEGDFDGDLKLDLAVLAFADLEAALWCGFDAAGPKVTAAGYVGQNALSLAAGDFDGDGALDLAVSNRDAARVSVARGDGHGGLVLPPLADVAVFPSSVVAADLDSDGRAEAIAVSAKSSELSVVRRHGAQLERAFHAPIGPAARAVLVADLDRDGHLDAAWIASDTRAARIEFAFGDGSVALVAREKQPPLEIGPSGEDLLALDLDGDGAPELVAADPESNALRVFRRAPAGSPSVFLATPQTLPIAPAPLALAALPSSDGAARIAIVLGGPGPRTGVVRARLAVETNGTTTMTVLTELAHVPLTGAPLDLAALRLSGPTADDLVVLGADTRDSANGWLRVLRANDTAPTQSFVPGLKAKHVACGDLDGDGRDDVLVASLNSHAVNLWFARDGALVPWPNLGAGLGVHDVACGDADGDGRLDVFVADAFGDDVALILNGLHR